MMLTILLAIMVVLVDMMTMILALRHNAVFVVVDQVAAVMTVVVMMIAMMMGMMMVEVMIVVMMTMVTSVLRPRTRK